MEYCGPARLKHSKFLKWSDDDREKALRWLERDRSRCGGCGIPPEDWDPARGGAYDAYAAEVQMCEGCRLRGASDGRLREMHESLRAGFRTYLVPNDNLEMWR